MKMVIRLILLMLFSVSLAHGQVRNHKGIEFDTLTHDFGLIEKGSDASCSFSFANRDESPVIITNVKSSCGCTVPEWPREPFKPGESGSISIRYNTQITGIFQKTVYIYTNLNSQPIGLTVKGSVKKKQKKR